MINREQKYSYRSGEKNNDHLIRKIMDLKKELNALIVAHYYEREEVQSLADITGDSYALACEVKKAPEKVVVFCGVKFMAESAAILSPEKNVLLPVEEAGCPLADMATVDKLKQMKEEHPEAAVVCYVNSTALVKAESDICCTSSNAVDIVRNLSEEKIIFLPDRNLGAYVQKLVPEKDIIIWPGYCPVHQQLGAEEVIDAKRRSPKAHLVVHPECRKEVLDLADHIGSTGAIIKYISNSPAKEFIVGTEKGIITKLEKENSDKRFYSPLEEFTCADMKLTTLSRVARSLEQKAYKIEVPEELAGKARVSLERMLEVSGRRGKERP